MPVFPALASTGMSASDVEKLKAEVQKELEEAVAFAENSPEPATSDLMEDVYA